MSKTKLCKCGCKREIPKGLRAYYSDACVKRAKKARDKTKKWHKQRGITKKKLDTLWSKLVRLRDGKCRVCKATENLQAHHIFSRTNYATRWLLGNGITLCPKHHLFDNTMSAHQAPTEFAIWLIKEIGAEAINELGRQARSTGKPDLDEWWQYLKAQESMLCDKA